MNVPTGLARARWIGLGIIVAANFVALIGVQYNGIGPAQSVLRLSDREIRLPYTGDADRENTGLSLSLSWCVLPAEDRVEFSTSVEMGCFERQPIWLDSAKLASLGFDVDVDPRVAAARRYYNRQLPKPALLVLELAGEAYDSTIAAARDKVNAEEAAAASLPDSVALQRRAKTARDRFERLERESSRLFVVDAGNDLAGLRAKHPDRERIAVVQGSVRPRVTGSTTVRVGGEIDILGADVINVPREFRAVFDSLPRGRSVRAPRRATTPIEVAVAFGKRMEPWIRSAERRPD